MKDVEYKKTETEDDDLKRLVESAREVEKVARPSATVQHRPTSLGRLGVLLGVLILTCTVAGILLWERRSSRSEAEKVAAPQTATETTDVVTTSQEQLRQISVVQVDERYLPVSRDATGKVSFDEDLMTPVFSPYTGKVVGLIAKPGDVVRKGSPLFEIDTPDLVQAESDLLTNMAAVQKANNVLRLATRSADRLRRLFANEAVPKKDLEQAESDVKSAESDLRSAEATLAASRDRLRVLGKSNEEISKLEADHKMDRITKVFSPLAGTITARKVGPGQYVKPDNPDPLFTIADLSTMWMLANVYESDVPLVKVGQPVEVHVQAYPNETFRARIDYIAPSADPNTHRIAVRCVVENRGLRLKPEMFATFRITSSFAQSLTVPAKAIVREGDNTIVWVLQGDKQFTRRPVTTGIEQDGHVQILSGLESGDRVATDGSLFLSRAGKT